jgi:protein tyrosine phosphatase (PTP) superfamily phosphohydrolase (DUF442 family)
VNPNLPETRGFSPLPPGPLEDSRWKPADIPGPSVRLGAPEPYAAVKPGEKARLLPPEVTEQVTPGPQKPAGQQPAAAERPAPPPLPVGIPQFAAARQGVTSGLRPMLDGLDWLQSNGYRTVLHLRRPGEDDGPDRKQIEQRGLKYLSLEVSPQTLAKPLVDEFNRIVGDAGGHPLFVYDRDGSLAGGMWYLSFRLVDGAAEELARVRANALGVREERDGGHREMWEAVRAYAARETSKEP